MGRRVDSEGNLLDSPGMENQQPESASKQPSDEKKAILDQDQRNLAIHMRSLYIRRAMFLINKAGHQLKESAKYYDGSQNPDFDDYHHNVGAAETYLELAHDELEDICDRDHTQELIKYAPFWKDLCELGLSLCEGPSPMKENQKSWFLTKNSTLKDKAHGWTYSYPSLDKAVEAAYKYWADGMEPKGHEWLF